jgi:hypothetical protein
VIAAVDVKRLAGNQLGPVHREREATATPTSSIDMERVGAIEWRRFAFV